MAARNTGKKGEPRSGDVISELDKFLNGFVELASDLVRGMTAQSTDADERQIIAAYAKPLNEQVSQLSDYIRANARNIPAQTSVEIGHVLRLNAASSLVESGKTISENLSSTTAKIALGDIIKLIKKIIDVIVKLILGYVPAWLEALKELIDELVDFILSLGSPKLANTLSRRHQDYLAELTRLEELTRAQSWMNGGEDEEE